MMFCGLIRCLGAVDVAGALKDTKDRDALKIVIAYKLQRSRELVD